jgi:hypothetical protein
MWPGANPTAMSFNAGIVKIYNATSSLVRFEKKILLLLPSLLQRWRCSCM